MDEILAVLRSLPGVLELAPVAGSEHPEISWGDHFFYYAPDGEVPTNRQPYATFVTKDYPDDASSQLSAPGRWRLNIHVGPELLASLVSSADPSEPDAFFPHPLYGDYGWVAVVNPGPVTMPRALDALREAHAADQRRVERRHS
ncbi:hypothetical protein EYE40_05465 [Glaciihabitans arcticus]|uniref:DUF6194 domain-containing protein n=1 Tax=Glaciihabitans arcticus TaxID=2668039 RepID=A0A4Q9GPV7_9MICO|nr:DUF6194 family protein [Glaciihabitans arcticus]TBN56892.1 hypothetical protein EYE40_05465 [Glaciihabitans arcticus]